MVLLQIEDRFIIVNKAKVSVLEWSQNFFLQFPAEFQC